MFKRFKWPVLIATVFALLTPAAAMAQRRDRGARTPERHERRAFVQHEHHDRHPRFNFSFGVNRYPRSYFVAPYAYPYGYYSSGYYDQWGYWHPYNGYYDAWGVWHWTS